MKNQPMQPETHSAPTEDALEAAILRHLAAPPPDLVPAGFAERVARRAAQGRPKRSSLHLGWGQRTALLSILLLTLGLFVPVLFWDGPRQALAAFMEGLLLSELCVLLLWLPRLLFSAEPPA